MSGKSGGRRFREVEEMLELDLDLMEREVLSDIIETILADLRMEIGRTDRKDFREKLKNRKRVLRKTLCCLRGQDVDGSEEPQRGLIRL